MTHYVPICLMCLPFLYPASAVAAGSSVESSLSGTSGLSAALEQISIERMLADIRTLSGPVYGGRLTGSRQDEASATFIANRFSELRLHRSPALPPENRTNPLPQREWKQTAPMSARTIDGQPVVELVTSQQR